MGKGGAVQPAKSNAMVQEKLEKKLRSKKIQKKVPKASKIKNNENKMQAEEATKSLKVNKIKAQIKHKRIA